MIIIIYIDNNNDNNADDKKKVNANKRAEIIRQTREDKLVFSFNYFSFVPLIILQWIYLFNCKLLRHCIIIFQYIYRRNPEFPYYHQSLSLKNQHTKDV